MEALKDIGGELLVGSGFEDETPEPEFTQQSASECKAATKRVDFPVFGVPPPDCHRVYLQAACQ